MSNNACEYCGGEELVYELTSKRQRKHRCIRCLAVEQLQQQFTLPFDVWIEKDEISEPDGPNAPDIPAFDPREHDYNTVKAWSRVLARYVEDEPLLKRDDTHPNAVFTDTREFIENVMGSDAYKSPSEIRGK